MISPDEGHSSKLNSIIFSKGGKFFISCGESPSIIVWLTETRKIF